jgi:hypothetical protein
MKLGDTIRDTISGFTGVLVARTEWLNGCVRLTIQPKTLHEGKRIDNDTFDIEQCELVEAAQPKTAVATGGERENISRPADPR